MGKNMNIGVNNTAHRVKKKYIGVNNVARKVTKGYVGVNNVARKYFESSPNRIQVASVFDKFSALGNSMDYTLTDSKIQIAIRQNKKGSGNDTSNVTFKVIGLNPGDTVSYTYRWTREAFGYYITFMAWDNTQQGNQYSCLTWDGTGSDICEAGTHVVTHNVTLNSSATELYLGLFVGVIAPLGSYLWELTSLSINGQQVFPV